MQWSIVGLKQASETWLFVCVFTTPRHRPIYYFTLMLSASLACSLSTFSPLYAQINKGKSKKQNITAVCFCLFVCPTGSWRRARGCWRTRKTRAEGPAGPDGGCTQTNKQTNNSTCRPVTNKQTAFLLGLTDCVCVPDLCRRTRRELTDVLC